MASRSLSLGDVAAGANGSAYGIANVKDAYVAVSGTFSGTWKVQLSSDGGTTWSDFDTGSAAKLVGPLPRCATVRGILGAGSGTAKFRLTGEDDRVLPLSEITLGDVAAAADGSVVDISGVLNPYVQIFGTFSATWTLAVSSDGGSTWVTFDTGSAAKLVGPLPRVGLARLSLGSGTGTVKGRLFGGKMGGPIRGAAFADLTSATSVTAVNVLNCDNIEVWLHSDDFVGTYKVQVSMDAGSTYVDHTSTVVSSGSTGVIVKPPKCDRVRVNVSAYTSGTLSSQWAATERALVVQWPA